MRADGRLTVIVCSGPVCRDRRGSGELRAHLEARIAAGGLGGRLDVAEEVCFGHCLRGPNVVVCDGPGQTEGAVLYDHMTVADLDRVVDRHLAGGMAIRVLMNRPPDRGR